MHCEMVCGIDCTQESSLARNRLRRERGTTHCAQGRPVTRVRATASDSACDIMILSPEAPLADAHKTLQIEVNDGHRRWLPRGQIISGLSESCQCQLWPLTLPTQNRETAASRNR